MPYTVIARTSRVYTFEIEADSEDEAFEQADHLLRRTDPAPDNEEWDWADWEATFELDEEPAPDPDEGQAVAPHGFI